MTDNLLQKYAGRRPEEIIDPTGAEGEPLDDLGSFGWLRGVRDRSLMLELRRKDGHVLAVGYAWLERAEFNPSTGITLHIVGQKIRILGRNLNQEVRPHVRLFQGLTRHRIPWIQEAEESTVIAAPLHSLLVERIEW